MKRNGFLTILIVLTLSLAILFASCDKTGEETTAPTVTEAPATDAPTEPADETTSEPETEAPDTTKAEETTEAPHTHTFGAWNTVKAASCSEEGVSERACSCGEKETQSIAKTSHINGEWIEDKAATCTENGSKHLECSVCKASLQTESLPALGHKDGEWIIDKEATANADGSKHLECSVCKATIKTEVLPATPHVPGEWIVEKEATCTEAGSRYRVCTKCGETTDREVVSVKSHTEVADKAVAATCTESGLTEGKHCSVCNTVTKAQTKISAKGHTEASVNAKAATCTESGLTEGKYCSVCNATLKAQETIPAKGHTEVIDNAKAATCTESGLTEGKHCSVCNTVVKAQETIPAKGHTAGDWIVDKEATTSSAGSKHIACSVCGATLKTEEIPIIELPKIDYTVTVLDGMGFPMEGVEVSFMNENTAAAKAVTDKDGKASVKLTSGEYSVEIAASDDYFVPSEAFKVNADAPALEITLVAFAKDPEMVYPGATETDTVLAGVYNVDLGSFRVPVEKGKIRYLFFTPKEGAVYHIYTDSDKVEVGYYGGSFFVTPNNTGVVDENGVLIYEFLHTSVGSKVVLGLTATSASVDSCTVTIIKASDIEIQDVERPWEQYVPTQIPDSKVTTPSGTMKYVPIEINFSTMQGTKEIEVVYNEKDGYYHLNTADGPVLYVRISQSTKYMDPLKSIVEFTNIGRYFYDEDGKLIKKESYCDAIYINTHNFPNNKNPYYAQVADSKYGVVPLNEELIYILKNMGADDWYVKSSPDYIFDNATIPADVMPQNAWLFACVYFE